MRDKLWAALADMLPRALVKYALMRAFAHAAIGAHRQVTCAEVLKRWQGGDK